MAVESLDKLSKLVGILLFQGLFDDIEAFRMVIDRPEVLVDLELLFLRLPALEEILLFFFHRSFPPRAMRQKARSFRDRCHR